MRSPLRGCGLAGRRNGIADSSPGHSRLETAIADERPGYRAGRESPPQTAAVSVARTECVARYTLPTPARAPFTTASKAAVVGLPFGRGLLAACGAPMAGGAVDDFRAVCAALQRGIKVIAV